VKILSPVKSVREARELVAAGAEEFYCGVMPGSWQARYSNVASPNRREWAVSNMTGFDEVTTMAEVAHAGGTRLFLALNALYTEKQYPEIEEFVRQAGKSRVDALIVADLGLLLDLRRMGWEGDIHVSTGGTIFNDETVAFYRELGACRVILERQNRISEIVALARNNPDLEVETFILNCGCKNIDGFCTHHHGINEVRVPLWWNVPKKLRLDHYLLSYMKRMPLPVREKISHSSMFGSVGACFLSYDIDIASATASPERQNQLRTTFRNSFNLFSGFDTCGACAMPDLLAAGVKSLKIVGRGNPLHKKLQDVRFLKTCREYWTEQQPQRKDYESFCRTLYRKTYGYACDNWCYYPLEDAAIGAETL